MVLRQGNHAPSLKKKCKIPLDKLHKVWYNKNTIKGRKTDITRKGKKL